MESPQVRPWSRRRKALAGAGAGLLLAAAVVVAADRAVAAAAAGRIHSAPSTAPSFDVALVLGTSPTTRGRANEFFESRMDAAAALFRAGAVRGILASGDNSVRGYDEPAAMREALVSRGVPAEFVTVDCAGFSTLDSVVRARRVFGLDRVLIVSQRFHLERALFLARGTGLDAEGYAAADGPLPWRARVRARESLARVKAVADAWSGRGPRFLGPPVLVPLAPAVVR